MKKPKTIKGYLSCLKQIEEISPSTLKGFDKLTDKQKKNVFFLDAEISNGLGEIWDD